jgi:hypothetical protein
MKIMRHSLSRIREVSVINDADRTAVYAVPGAPVRRGNRLYFRHMQLLIRAPTAARLFKPHKTWFPSQAPGFA